VAKITLDRLEIKLAGTTHEVNYCQRMYKTPQGR